MNLPRALTSLFVATALTFAPATAFAGEYGGDEDEEMVVTETNPEEGEPFTVVLDAGDGPDNDEVTLTLSSDDQGVGDEDIDIAGSQSMTKATTAGRATFSVTLHEEGSYSLVGRDGFGNVIARTTVIVGDGVPGAGDGTAGGDDDAVGGSAGGLGSTGASLATTALAVGGSGLVLAGGALLLVGRRRVRATA